MYCGNTEQLALTEGFGRSPKAFKISNHAIDCIQNTLKKTDLLNLLRYSKSTFSYEAILEHFLDEISAFIGSHVFRGPCNSKFKSIRLY